MRTPAGTTRLWPRHPALSAGIIGPRRVVLSDEVLDRIDEIVPPGIDVAPLEGAAYVPPAISELALRRRPAEKRAAA